MKLAGKVSRVSLERLKKQLNSLGIPFELREETLIRSRNWQLWILESTDLERAQILLSTLPKEGSCSKKSFEKRPWISQTLIALLLSLHSFFFFLPFPTATSWKKWLLIDSTLPSAASWHGLYFYLVASIHQTPWQWNLDSFLPDIRSGELWRFFSATLLHADSTHLLFNILCVSLLGSMIELKIGQLKFLSLLLTSAAASSLSQYLFTGPSFLGFSSIVMAFVAFVYARCRYFPWEHYPTPSSTFLVVGLYLLFTVSLQLLSFVLETFSIKETTTDTANTAHLAGLFLGWLIGRSKTICAKR